MRFKPTLLIVKEHNITGLRYFHKTTKLDKVDTYAGSGKYWLRHLKKYGNDWRNLWVSEVFYDKNLCEEFALAFSELHQVDTSDKWANLILENGINGGDNPMSRTPEVIAKRVETFKQTAKENPWKQSDSFKEARSLDKSNYWKSDKGVQKKAERYSGSMREFIDLFIGPPNPPPLFLVNKSQVTCPHCGKSGQQANMKAWHFDNCESLVNRQVYKCRCGVTCKSNRTYNRYHGDKCINET